MLHAGPPRRSRRRRSSSRTCSSPRALSSSTSPSSSTPRPKALSIASGQLGISAEGAVAEGAEAQAAQALSRRVSTFVHFDPLYQALDNVLAVLDAAGWRAVVLQLLALIGEAGSGLSKKDAGVRRAAARSICCGSMD